MNDLRIVFMGTPEFAVGILDTIIQHNFKVVGVITAVDKPAGRGQQLKYSAVKEYALEKGLHLMQPSNLKDPNFVQELAALEANVQVVVAFRMLPEVVWRMPELGTFNLHASLLPNYRGAAPINWAIINGEKETGVTTFFIDDKIDTGAMILSKSTPIDSTENAGVLHDRLMELGCEAVVETLDQLKSGTIVTTVQTDTPEIKTAYKLNKENCKLDFTREGLALYNQVRGLSPYPAAWCYIKDDAQEWAIKIYETEWLPEAHTVAVGTWLTTKKEISIAVHGGFLKLKRLQFPGKKQMVAIEVLNGMKFSENCTVF
ncbi:MAG: Methionyl-tRNA formyltransferase [Bacteroidota bacterium]|jgi:methionyl-tRNA formyltransferase